MVFNFVFPDVGEGIEKGILKHWKVKQGDKVKVDQPLCEVETDKAVVEMPSPKAGTILKLFHKEGDTINVGEVLVVIGEEGEKYDEKQSQPLHPVRAIDEKEEKKEEKPKTPIKNNESKTKGKTENNVGKSGNKTEKDTGKEEHYTGSVVGYLEEAKETMKENPKEAPQKEVKGVQTTLAIRKLAKDLGVDINAVKGTGAGGRVTEQDVKDAVGKASTVSNAKASQSMQQSDSAQSGMKITRKYDMWGYIDRIPFTGIRKIIADRMMQSQTQNASVTYHIDVNADELSKVRESMKRDAESRGIKLTYLAFIARAIVKAGEKWPLVNASVQDEEIIVKKYFNIGIAVDTDKGLFVPVIKRAEGKTVLDMAKEIAVLAEKTKAGKLDIMDMKGGSITISNLGSIGIDYFTPIINPPEASIIGIGKIRDNAIVKDGKIVSGKIIPISFTADHRVVDGAYSARFLNELKGLLEKPEGLVK